MESGDQKAVNEHDKLARGQCKLGEGKKIVFQHMLMKTAPYPSVDQPLATDSK